MFPYMLRIVKECRPRAVLIENVRGIYTARFTAFREKINKELDALGFDAHWNAFNASDFGVPQNRYRVFLVALRRGATKPLRWPEPAGQPLTVGAAIGDLMGARGWKRAQVWADHAIGIAPTIVGGSHKHGGPDLGPTRARREWAALGVDGLGLADEPPEPEFNGMPRLTVPMVARLQSFPDDWKFIGSKTNAYRQVGNALPVALAYKVSSAVRACLA
jgi:DNA (cytosine-5)-methyltransferase 1